MWKSRLAAAALADLFLESTRFSASGGGFLAGGERFAGGCLSTYPRYVIMLASRPHQQQ